MRARRATGLAATVAIGVLVATAAMAWACSPQPRIIATSAQTGRVGTVVSVRGEAAATGPVEIRWNSVTGAAIGSAMADAQGNFAATATVPQAAPGIYALVVATPKGAVARTAFELTASSAPAEPARSLWQGLAEPTRNSSSSGLGAGAVVLALGLVTACSAVGVATLRRRRPAAGAGA